MRNVEPGFRVVGSDGAEVGTVASCWPEYCQVNTGILGLGNPLYIPMDAISQTEGNTVFLNVPTDRLAEMRWSEPPVGAGEHCQTGYYGTMPRAETAPPPSGQPAPPTSPGVNELAPAALQAIPPGWPVICAEGRQVGTVASARPDGVVMGRGWWIFRYKVFVPAATIRRIDDVGHRVYLSVGCDAVDHLHSV